MYETSSAEVERIALDHGRVTLRVRQEPDRLRRSDISWTRDRWQRPGGCAYLHLTDRLVEVFPARSE
jgi:hypothetical protein